MKGQLVVGGFICMLLCASSPAYAGWFVPEDKIAWQAWHDGDDKTSLEHWDHSSKGLFGRATVLLHMHRLRKAERGFRQALDTAAGLEPTYIAGVWYNLGNCLYAEGMLKQAREAWHQALAFNPEHAKAAYNLAIVERLLKGRRERRQDVQVSSASRQGVKPTTHKRGGDADGGLPSTEENEAKHKGDGGGDVGSVNQAKREVNKVRDAMDVFLRHRLAAKRLHAMPAHRGNPW